MPGRSVIPSSGTSTGSGETRVIQSLKSSRNRGSRCWTIRTGAARPANEGRIAASAAGPPADAATPTTGVPPTRRGRELSLAGWLSISSPSSVPQRLLHVLEQRELVEPGLHDVPVSPGFEPLLPGL